MTGNRILVVEDNERNLKLVRDVLQYAGYDVIAASSGEQGVALARERVPDLVLMDLQLPEMDGAAALRMLRNDPLTREIPVVAVTPSDEDWHHGTPVRVSAPPQRVYLFDADTGDRIR